jgi:putative ABC transport system permease protein
LNWRVLAFTVAVAATSALLFGFLPALASITPGLAASLKEGRRESVGGGGRRLRGALVAVEVALALVRLIGAGLTVRSFDLLTRVSPGFASRGILTFGVSLPEAVYKEPSQNAAFFERLVSELRSVPGATDSAAVMILPLSASGFGGTFSIDGRPDGSGTSEPRAQLRPVTPGYFRTVGLGVSRGRGFGDPDTADAAPVAVISETTARRFWPGENPVGKRLRMHVSAVRGREPFREIVGVVPDVKTRQVDQPPSPVVYVPHAQHPTGYMNLIVKTAGDPAALSSGALAALQRLDRTLVALQVRPLDDHVAASRGAYRFRAILLGLFAAVAFLLAIVGLYSVVAYVVEQRRHEVGVRLALGATTGQVVGQIAAEGLRPVLVGVLLGGLAALAASKLLAGLLFGVRPYEPAVVAAVAALLLAAAAAACILPARRAAALDPRDVLRSE